MDGDTRWSSAHRRSVACPFTHAGCSYRRRLFLFNDDAPNVAADGGGGGEISHTSERVIAWCRLANTGVRDRTVRSSEPTITKWRYSVRPTSRDVAERRKEAFVAAVHFSPLADVLA